MKVRAGGGHYYGKHTPDDIRHVPKATIRSSEESSELNQGKCYKGASAKY